MYIFKREIEYRREIVLYARLSHLKCLYFHSKKAFTMYISQKNLNFTLYVPIYIQPAFLLLALITVSRQITSGSASRGQFFLAVLFPVPRKMLLKAGDFQQRNDASRPFPFLDDSRRAESREGYGGWSRGSRVGTQRGAVFFFTRGIAGISHKSREKPGAFEPLSFIVSTTSSSHDSNSLVLPSPSVPVTDFPFLPSDRRSRPCLWRSAADN